MVVYRRDGKLYEVHGNHCSCYGLEGQWEPEEATVESLRKTVGEKVFANYCEYDTEAKQGWSDALARLSESEEAEHG